MRSTAILLAIGLVSIASGAQAQRRGGGLATFAIMVTDVGGSPLGDVRVALKGPAEREARTERGRLVFENIPAGNYHLTFRRDGFLPFERDVTARGGAPIDVKVELAREPEEAPKPPPPPPLTPVSPIVDAEPVAIDVPSFIEKNYIGRSAGKTSLLACAAGGEATLIQLHDPLAEHSHAGADEYLYVIAGEGNARVGNTQSPLRAGVFLLVPRATAHTLTATGRSPLVLISIKAGEKCAPPIGH